MIPIHGNKKAKTTRFVFQLMHNYQYICISNNADECKTLSEFLYKHNLLVDDSCTFARFNKPFVTYEYHAQGAQIVIDMIDKE
jgi:hypothetical protein